MLQIRTKHFTYNPAVAGPAGSALGVLARRAEGRDTAGRQAYYWDLEGGDYRGYTRLFCVYYVSACELHVSRPGSGEDPEVVRSHSAEEGMAALGFTVELY